MTYDAARAAGRPRSKRRSTDWRRQGKVRRLWAARRRRCGPARTKAHWLGWLGITNDQLAARPAASHASPTSVEQRRLHPRRCCSAWAAPASCPEVLQATFGNDRGLPGAARPRLDRPRAGEGARGRASTSRSTLFIVSSKSGCTLEPNIFKQYFFERVAAAVGADEAGRRFVAITDPGSKLQHVAEGDGFRRHLLRLAEHRRALLGAVRLRHGARRR